MAHDARPGSEGGQSILPLTSDIAKFVATIDAGAMPERLTMARASARPICVGTMIAGADEPAVKLVAMLSPASTSNDGAPAISVGRNLSAADAALVNGVTLADAGSMTTMSAWTGTRVLR